MATDPLLDASVVYSINRFTGDGSRTSWDINFADGYISKDHVKAYVNPAEGVFTTQTLVWIGPNTVSITPAVENGVPLTIYRDTPKDAPVVDFTDGAIVNEINLDALAKQAVFAAAETVDRFTVTAGDALIAATAASALATSVSNAFNALVVTVTSIAGADLTQFPRLNVISTWSAAQRFNASILFDVGLVLGTVANGRTEYALDGSMRIAPAAGGFGSWGTPWTNLTFTPSNYAVASTTTTAIATAVTTAATDATTKASAAQAAAIAAAAADATAKVLTETNRAKNMEGFLFCWANR